MSKTAGRADWQYREINADTGHACLQHSAQRVHIVAGGTNSSDNCEGADSPEADQQLVSKSVPAPCFNPLLTAQACLYFP
jgi:hypothetical protein